MNCISGWNLALLIHGDPDFKPDTIHRIANLEVIQSVLRQEENEFSQIK